MINFLKKIFNIAKSIEKESIQKQHETNHELEWYFKREIKNCKLIKQNCDSIILEHLLRKKDILKTQNKLTVDEKKLLGINTRLSITKELIEVLNERGLKTHYPKSIISNLYHRAFFSKSRHDEMNKLRSGLLIDKVILRSSGGGGGDCEWCQSNQDIEFSVHIPIEKLIEENCSCDPYCYCYIQSVINLQEGVNSI